MRRVAGISVIVLLALGLSVTSRPASGAQITVTKVTDETPNGCTAGDCSLREAVLFANSTEDVETIVLGANTYQLSIPDPLAFEDENAGATGDLDIKRPVKIEGVFDGTSINQNATQRVLHVRKGSLTLKNVNATGGDTIFEGGGLLIEEGATATLKKAVVSFNNGGQGGGVSTHGGLTLIDSFVNDNVSGADGGGIAAFGDDVEILRSGVNDNDANASGRSGGGILFIAPSTLTVTDSVIRGNSTDTNGGGGIYVSTTGDPDFPDFTLTRSTVSDNVSTGRGGGLNLGHQFGQDSKFRIDDSTISGNESAAAGGGLYCGCPSPPLRITHTTITDNTADSNNDSTEQDGGGLTGSGVQFKIRASIIGDNHTPGETEEDCGENFISFSLGSNVTTEASCFINSDLSDDAVGLLDFLGPLADNGGPTDTHALLDDTSTADDRDQGSSCGGTDQRGVPRPFDEGCDSGSHEYATCGDFVVNIVGTDKDEIIEGTGGDDGIFALGGDDKVLAGGGADGVCGGGGDDKLFGGTGDDWLKGQGGIDKCFGEADTDTLNCETNVQD